MRTVLFLVIGSLALSAAAANAVKVGGSAAPWEDFDCSQAAPGADGTSAVFADPTTPGGIVQVDALCHVPGAPAPANDCPSTAYALTGWHWNAKYSQKVDPSGSGLDATKVVSAFGSNGATWDSSTSGSIWGGASQNSGGGNAGKKDGVNQVGFKNLGGSGTIAVTYTWSSGGVASESDAKYNTYYAWSLSGEAGKMDVQNIGTHEVGHSFGLGHTSTNNNNACLTMYPYADYGETQKRTLGQGDINGIKALYG